MTAPLRPPKTIRWVAVTLVAAAALVSIAVSYPRRVAQPVLGGDWQCSRTAFLMSCSRIDRGKAAVHSQRMDGIASLRG